jgi:hypothetical protein
MNKFHCETCQDNYEINGESCQDCCPHDELDHYQCMDCHKEMDPGYYIDMAEYQYEDR